jgi:hypothetical protein
LCGAQYLFVTLSFKVKRGDSVSRIASLTRALKEHDKYLEAKEVKLGRIDIYRRSQFDLTPPHFLFPLTHNWKIEGVPVSWGIEVVLNRIKAHDLWRDDTFIEKYIAQHEKEQESRDRDLRNSIESFLYDFRSEFKKATSDINTANLNKIYRKENSHGYSESRS